MDSPSPGTAEACCAKSKYTRCTIAIRVTLALISLIVGIVLAILNFGKYGNMQSGGWSCVSAILSALSLLMHISAWASGCSTPNCYIPLMGYFILGVTASLAALAGTIASIVLGVKYHQHFEKVGYHHPGERENSWIVMFMCLVTLRAGFFMLRFSRIYMKELKDARVPRPRYANQPSVVPIVGRADPQFTSINETGQQSYLSNSSPGGPYFNNAYEGSSTAPQIPSGANMTPYQYYVEENGANRKY